MTTRSTTTTTLRARAGRLALATLLGAGALGTVGAISPASAAIPGPSGLSSAPASDPGCHQFQLNCDIETVPTEPDCHPLLASCDHAPGGGSGGEEPGGDPNEGPEENPEHPPVDAEVLGGGTTPASPSVDAPVVAQPTFTG